MPIATSESLPQDTFTSSVRLWLYALIAGILAGVASWGAGEAAQGRFRDTLNELPPNLRVMAVSTNALKALKKSVMSTRATVAYGLLGGLLGLYLGLAGGLARRSSSATIQAAVIGLILGGAAGAGVSRLLVPIYFRMVESLSEEELGNDILRGLAIHAGIWASIGLAAGIALGWGAGDRGRIFQAMIGGLFGALIATVGYEIVGVSMFSTAKTGLPIATGATPRLLAHMLVGVLVALGAVFALRHLNFKRVVVDRSI